MFYAGGLGYYAQLLSLSYISGLKAKGYEPDIISFFGFPRGIKTGGVAFDIPMINVTANQQGDADKARQFTLQVGTLSSALEHITPEQMFAPTDPNAPKPDAISAVKALQKASAGSSAVGDISTIITVGAKKITDTPIFKAFSVIGKALGYAGVVLTVTNFVLKCPGEAGAVFGLIFGLLAIATMFLTGLKVINPIISFIVSKAADYFTGKVLSSRLCDG